MAGPDESPSRLRTGRGQSEVDPKAVWKQYSVDFSRKSRLIVHQVEQVLSGDAQNGIRAKGNVPSLIAANAIRAFLSPESCCASLNTCSTCMNDQAALAAEIHRVLVPDAFGINFRTALLPVRNRLGDSSGPAILSRIERVRRLRSRQSKILSTGPDKYERVGGGQSLQTHVFFVARKSERERQSAATFFAEYFSGKRRATSGQDTQRCRLVCLLDRPGEAIQPGAHETTSAKSDGLRSKGGKPSTAL